MMMEKKVSQIVYHSCVLVEDMDANVMIICLPALPK